MKIAPKTLLMLAISLATFMTITINAAEKDLSNASKSESQQHRGSTHSQEMHDHMSTMHTQMQAIHAEKDPEKRRALMQAHRQSMHDGMQMMRGMGSNGRMGMMHRESSNKGKMDEHARMDHMEHRMDMMQQMMEQMMQHEDAKHRHMHSRE